MPPKGGGSSGSGREIYFELVVVGSSVKVTAIDSASGTEVVVIGPANAARSDLERLAMGKLERKLAQLGHGS